jgi:hypothetical protein
MGSITHIHNNKPKTISQWKNYISEPWQKAVESIVETGQRLIEARENIEHGEWENIFKDNKPFSISTAKRLINIAEHPVLSNRAHAPVLPPSWYTLYEISQIPEYLLLHMIKDGRVHPELTRREAVELQGWEEKINELLTLLLNNSHSARELSLADCSGAHYDCSILKGKITQELIDATLEVVETWTKLTDHLISLRKEVS